MDNKFNARFGWFWYNDQEILHDTQEDIDRKMAKHAQMGITHVITFSSTHFRWSFRPFWNKINECLAKVVKAGHKYGIKVIEHHSCNLTHYPDTKEHWEMFEGEMVLRESTTKNWPGLEEWMMNPDNEVEKWAQIAGPTGKPVVAYGGHGKCFNNPDFVASYLKYLEDVYATGVDGIMTDDVHFFFPWACVCPHCRKKFKEQYNEELPTPEEWDKWVGDYNNPSFLNWLKFRYQTITQFHQIVKEHYEKLGLQMLRPNYTSVALSPTLTSYILDDLPAIDWVFQECCFSTVIRYTWPLYLLDQLQRRSMERHRQTPAMMMFYADRQDQLAFSWGIARLCSSLYTNTPEGKSTVDETIYRDFEKKYADRLFNCESLSTIGFLDSLKNRRFGAGYEASRMKFWIQSCFFENIPVELVDVNKVESWKQFSVICVNEVHVLSSDEIANLKDYVNNGGIVIVTGSAGSCDESLLKLSDEEISARWGFDFTMKPEEYLEVPYGKGKFIRPGYLFGYPGSKELKEKIFLTSWNGPMHNHKLIDLRLDIPEIWLQRAYRNAHSDVCVDAPNFDGYYSSADARKDVITLLKNTVKDNLLFSVENFPELVLAIPFVNRDNKKISIHMLNAAGTMKKGTEERISHKDLIPFPKLSGTGKLNVIIPPDCKIPEKVVFAVPGKDEVPLEFSLVDRKVVISLPLNLLETCGSILLD